MNWTQTYNPLGNLSLSALETLSAMAGAVASILDFFNLFNSSAAFGFVSTDDRSANFGVKTNFVPARVAQFGVRYVF